MEIAIVIVAVIGYLAFRQWLQLNRRNMIHRERLAAIEKGVDLPLLEQEARRRGWNVQRFAPRSEFRNENRPSIGLCP